jgi:hypothetical protein
VDSGLSNIDGDIDVNHNYSRIMSRSNDERYSRPGTSQGSSRPHTSSLPIYTHIYIYIYIYVYVYIYMYIYIYIYISI